MRVGSALSERTNVDDAVDDAATRLEAQLGDHPDVLFVFASPRLRGRLTEVPQRASARLGSPLVCGCSGDGVLADGRERERVPALAMMGIKLPDGARAQPLRVEAGARALTVGPRPTGVVLLADPFSTDMNALLRGFDASCRGSTMVGALASGARRGGRHALFLEGWTFHDGAVGVAFRGTLGIEAVVAQGCRPIGEPMIVTRADGPRILELDRGRPLDVLRDLHATLGEEDRKLMKKALFCGVQMRDSQIEYRAGDFLVREIVGIDEQRGALVIAADLGGYPVVQLHVRDRRASAEDLHNALRRSTADDVKGALLFSCVGRGAGLYGEPDHDSRALAEHFGPLPLAGFFGNGEIGPVQGTTYVHGNTSAFGLLRVTTERAARA
jgi:small ligand-binding sensory domain FIST